MTRIIAIILLTTALATAQTDLGKLGTEAARLRGLSYRPVKASVVTQKQAADYVLRLLDQELEPKRTAGRELFLKSLGLLPQKGSIKGVLSKLYAGQVRGLYDPVKKVYLVVQDAKESQDAALAASLGLDATEMYAVHELGHAIQDQHFNLEAISRRVTPNLDQAFAAQALIEGDASLLMMDFSLGRLGLDMAGLPLDLAGLDVSALAASDPSLAAAPPFFRDYVTGPYMHGLTFVAALRSQGGWKAVDAAFRSLPASSEQIFHPEKYLKDPPKNVRLVSLPEAFGPFRALADDTAGEVTVRVLCNQAGTGTAAAQGWGGDRFRAYSNGTQGFVLWFTVWDTVADAKEFEELVRGVRRDALVVRKNMMVKVALDVPRSILPKVKAAL